MATSKIAMFILFAACVIHSVLSANQSVKSQSPTVQSCAANGMPGVPGIPGRSGRDGRDGAKGDQGPVGAPGKSGPKGPTGLQGPSGSQGSQGSQGLPGANAQKNWKQCAWKNLNDGKDYGLIVECTFVKHAKDTALKVEFDGDYRICCCLNCCKRWFFTFNDAECNSPQAIDGLHSIHYNHGIKDRNIHKHSQIGGYCEGVDKGTVRVGFHIGDCVGMRSGSDGYTGWNSVTRIMIEEVPPPQK